MSGISNGTESNFIGDFLGPRDAKEPSPTPDFKGVQFPFVIQFQGPAISSIKNLKIHREDKAIHKLYC